MLHYRPTNRPTNQIIGTATLFDNICFLLSGGQDSCNGDSGSALYTLINNVPTIFGRVQTERKP